VSHSDSFGVGVGVGADMGAGTSSTASEKRVRLIGTMPSISAMMFLSVATPTTEQRNVI
jgi:hypothetical protein